MQERAPKAFTAKTRSMSSALYRFERGVEPEARVIDENVDTRESGFDVGERGRHLRFIRDVRDRDSRLTAELAHALRDGHEPVRAAGDESDPRLRAREPIGGRLPDAARGAGHDDRRSFRKRPRRGHAAPFYHDSRRSFR